MSDEHRSIEDIERDIDRKRADIGAGIAELQERLSPDSIVTDAKSMLRQNFIEISGPISRAARTNPLAVALIGLGLVWLATGSAKSKVRAARGRERMGLPRQPTDPEWFRGDDPSSGAPFLTGTPGSTHPRPASADGTQKELYYER